MSKCQKVSVMIIGEGFSVDGVGLFLQPSLYNRGFMAPRVILTGQHKWQVRQRNAPLQKTQNQNTQIHVCVYTFTNVILAGQLKWHVPIFLRKLCCFCPCNMDILNLRERERERIFHAAQGGVWELEGEGAEKVFRDGHDLCIGSPHPPVPTP